jgi:dihydroorotase
LARLKAEIGEENLNASHHPIIRDSKACLLSSQLAIELAKKNRTRLHILHISTAEETELFQIGNPSEKLITAEACIHHLWFSDQDYPKWGNLIKWNPAIKSETDRQAIWNGLLSDKIDVIATDHAPHTFEEKQEPYLKAPSGGPLVQHALLAMLEFWKDNKISLEQIVRKMCHSVADCFQIEKRGYIREGYWADLVLVDPNQQTVVSQENIHAKCGWSPFMDYRFSHQITHTLVSGHLAYQRGIFDENVKGRRLTFER